eukprot:3778540-Pyramimonas_sp.AAC.1
MRRATAVHRNSGASSPPTALASATKRTQSALHATQAGRPRAGFRTRALMAALSAPKAPAGKPPINSTIFSGGSAMVAWRALGR